MYGLLGKTLSHSFSSEIHKVLNPSLSYELYETNDIESFIRNVAFEGLNVTNPYKKDMLSLLDELDESSAKTGVVNTVKKEGHQLKGFNTDYLALKTLMNLSFQNRTNQSVGILGNGATMRSVKQALRDLNYQNITVYARHPDPGEHPLSELSDRHEILINATPVGMFPHNHDTMAEEIQNFQHLDIAMDLIYNPLKTNFLLNAQSAGAKVFNGLPLLFLQAAYAQNIWLDRPIPKDWQSEVDAFESELKNIVLIGLPFSGKSHYGYLLERHMNKKYIDIDRLIEAKANTKIETIFQTMGEEKFRGFEHDITIKKAKQHRQIIATGGGIVQNKTAMQSLKQNGLIVWLDVASNLVEKKKLSNRPLIKTLADWKALKKRRQEAYQDYADIIIEKDTEDEAIILERLKEVLHGYFSH